MQKTYISLNLGQSKTQKTLFFKLLDFREMQLLCDPYTKLILKVFWFPFSLSKGQGL